MLLDHHFLVEIDGVADNKFFSVGGLTLWRNVVETRYGSSKSGTPLIEPGEGHVNNIVLRRHLEKPQSDLYHWYIEQSLGVQARDVVIKLLNRQHEPVMSWRLRGCVPVRLSYSDLTADSILKLTELLDYLVYRASMDTVPLSKEVQLLENYLGLEELRYGEKLQLSAKLEVQNDNIAIAPLLLLPFAENCFKHGGTGSDGIFRVELFLHSDHQKLSFRLRNSKRKANNAPTHSGGVGLENIQKRLNLLYPERHQLQINNVAEHYEVTLEILF